MISFYDAYLKAYENDPEIDTFEEYENAYVFSAAKNTDLIGPSPIVIYKEWGELGLMSSLKEPLGKEIQDPTDLKSVLGEHAK